MDSSSSITRREAIARGAAVAAAALLPADVLAASRARKRPLPSIHCLPPADRFTVADVLGGCSFAAFSPDGARLACTTPDGVEVRPRAGGAPIQLAPAGFRVLGQPWHPDGRTLVASGPGGVLAPAEAPFAVQADGSGVTRLLTDFPGQSRALSFAPDGRRVALTYVDGFVHRMLLADWTAGGQPRLDSPRVLLPLDPRTEPDTGRMMRGLAWHETRGFTPDGRGLVFSSDRAGGLLNVNAYVLDLGSGRVRHVTHDDGFTEGAVVGPGDVLFYGSTRAREPAFLTLVTGPQLPPFLGLAAAPALHDVMARGHRAPIGNGDVIAADGRTGLGARIVAKRELLAAAAGIGAPETEHRVRVCSVSPDGRELAVAVAAPGGEAVVILRRDTVPPAPAGGATPVPPTAAPLAGGGLRLLQEEPVPVVRKLPARFGGDVELSLDGTPDDGTFEATFHDFSDDGLGAYDGRMRFEPGEGGFRHEADVTRVRGSDAGEEDAPERGFYRASVTVDRPDVRGSLEGRSPRSGAVRALALGGAFVPQGRWTAGRRSADGVPGAEPCRRRRRRKRRRRRRKKR